MEARPDVYFKYMQLLHAIPNTWRSQIRNSSFTYTEIPESCVLVTCDKQYTLEQLTSKLIYDILIVRLFVQPTSIDYWKNTLRLKDELEVLGQKPPGQKPPGHKPPDKNPPCQKPPGQKPPRQNILFRNFITFVFRMSYGKEISIWFLVVKYVRHGSIK